MSILQNIIAGNNTASDKTVNDITQLMQLAYKNATVCQERGVKLVWANQYGLTPQQVCDALGTSAAAIFTAHGELTDFVASVQVAAGGPANVHLPTNAFTVNPDGTVTVLETPYVPAP